MIIGSVFACAIFLADGEPFDQVQFHEVITRLHQDWKDVSMIFEGESRREHAVEQTRPDLNVSFQGEFTANARGEWYQETFTRSLINGVEFREAAALSEKKMLQDLVQPDLFTRKRGIRTTPMPPGMYSLRYTPAEFILPFLLKRFKSVNDYGYQFLGWDEIDGHRCLKVMIDATPRSTSPSHAVRVYWIDLERGGHALRIQVQRNGELAKEFDEIKLQEFPVKGGSVWFPVRARIRDYYREGKAEKDPFSVETIYVVNGTLVMNQGLSENAFDLEQKVKVPAHPRLNKLRSTVDERFFQRASAEYKARAAQRVMDLQLKKGSDQAGVLDAQKSAQAEQSWNSVLQVVVPCTAGVMICLGLVWWRTRKQ